MGTTQLLIFAAVAALLALITWLLWIRMAKGPAPSSPPESPITTPPALRSPNDTIVIPAHAARPGGVVASVRHVKPGATAPPSVMVPSMSRKDISASATSTFRTWASDFPPLPPAAARIWEEVRSAEPNARRVAGIVAQDPVMTAQLLRMANSVATAQTQEVTSTEQAILLMGYDCVLALAIRETLPVGQQLPLGGYDLEALTRHSVATGLFAGVVARITGRVDSAEAVTMGVMHDIGKLVMNTADPALVRRLLDSKTSVPEESPLRKEERLFGANHAIIGALLASEWHLPRLLVNALEFHHYPTTPELDGLGNRDRGLTATVFVANQLAKLAGFSGNDEDVDLLPQQVVDSLELPGSYEAIAHEVLPEVLVRLKAFGYSPKT